MASCPIPSARAMATHATTFSTLYPALPPKVSDTAATSTTGSAPSRILPPSAETVPAPQARAPSITARATGSSRSRLAKKTTARSKLDERDQLLVVGVQHHRTRRAHGIGHDRLHARHGRQIVDAIAAQVVVADVGDQRGVAALDGETAPEDATASRLEHREVDAPVAEHDARGSGSGPVAALDDLGADRDLVARRGADMKTCLARHARQEARGGRLAVGPGHQRHRDRTQVLPGHLVHVGELGARPAGGPRPLANADVLVVPEQRERSALGLREQGQESRASIALDQRADLALLRLEAERLPPRQDFRDRERRPFAHLGARQHHIDGRFVADDGSAPMDP
jgi:hypothetical protein